MKNKNLVPLLALAAGGLYLANQTGNKASTTQEKALAFTGDTLADEEALKDALVKVIKANNIELRTLLRGNDGAKGDKGDTGETGLAGSQIQNYGGSLVKNGALELGTLEGWTGATLGDANNLLAGSVKTTTTAISQNSFIPVLDRLYSVEYYVKNEGVVTAGGGVAFEARNLAGNIIDISKRVYPVGGWVNSNSENFVKKKLFFGGYGTANHNIKDSTSTISPLVFKNEGVSISVNALIIKMVDLGEPVPHNLPFLPVNQTVLNATTGKVGIYNGTTVDYYM